MTPARLEEVRVHLEHQRRYYRVRGQAPRPVSIAVELLAEVKRLREVLRLVQDAPDGFDGAILPEWLHQRIHDALTGKEPTP